MRIKRLIYLLTFITVSIAIEYKKETRSIKPLKIINADSDDAELLRLEASGSKNKNKDAMEQEKVKTLSQQVADGKYGLIQKELFSKPPKRPGILSYELNPEVPNDNKNNLGGLDKNEIWLAENHLLIVRGGSFPPYENKQEDSLWPPLDTYKAPLHQVKIPLNPKVPPPFPVQLTEDGPLQILGTNFSRTLNETDKSTSYTVSSQNGENPYGEKVTAGNSDTTDTSTGSAPLPIPVINPGEFSPGVSFPLTNLNETWSAFLKYLPPGAVILPPPDNQTDLYDDDDPSIYYPPPYSFFYPQDNSSKVAAGPLVPGIILPPPPNFFALLEEEKPNTAVSTEKPPQKHRKPTTPKSNRNKTPTTMKVKQISTVKPVRIYPVKDETVIDNKLPEKVTVVKPEIVGILQIQNKTYLPPRTNRPHFVRKNPQNRTRLRPVKHKTTTPPKVFVVPNDIPHNTLNNKPKIVTSTQVPLTYYTTSTDININAEKNVDQITFKTKLNKTVNEPVRYYYYGEPEKDTVTTKVPIKQNNYYNGPTEGFYIPPTPSRPVQQRKPQYIYVQGKPYNTQRPRFRLIQQPVKTNTFDVHIAKIQNQIRQYYNDHKTTKKPSPKPVYQYSFQAENYQSQNNFDSGNNYRNAFNVEPDPPTKYSVQIQQAIEIFPTQAPIQQTTENPNKFYTTVKPYHDYVDVSYNPSYYHQVTTARPILEYSFEVTQNPVFQGFYTKPDEKYFDDSTRQHFTAFGKKLVSNTTPLPNYKPRPGPAYLTVRENVPEYQKDTRYNQKPILLGPQDIVNYLNQKTYVNQATESTSSSYPKVIKYSPHSPQYNNRPKNKQEPEIVKAIEIPVNTKKSRDGSYVSYELPGEDGDHFYYLTPEFTHSKEQGSEFYYSRPQNKRIQRDNIKSDKER